MNIVERYRRWRNADGPATPNGVSDNHTLGFMSAYAMRQPYGTRKIIALRQS